MKTVIATLALSLAGAVSLAKSLDNTVGSRLPGYIDGSAHEQAANMFVSQNGAVSLARSLDGTVGSRLPRYIAGSAHEQATNMFVSQEPRAEVRSEAASFDRLRAGLLDLHGRRH